MPLASYIQIKDIPLIDLSGKGGKESLMATLLPGWKRVPEELFDYEMDAVSGILRVELKKQRNEQWFDVGKYYDLSADDRNIWLLFVIHSQGRITHLLAVKLGCFVDFLCVHPEMQKVGWNAVVFQTAKIFKDKYPSLQFKVSAKILTLYKNHPEIFELIYKSPALANSMPIAPN